MIGSVRVASLGWRMCCAFMAFMAALGVFVPPFEPAEAKVRVRAVKRPAAVVRDGRRDPLMAEAWRGGQQLLEEGKLKSAAAYLRRYLSVMPRSSDGWFWLGRTYMAMGDFGRARNAFQRALAVDPYYPSLQPDRLDPHTGMPLWPEITPPE